MKQNFPPFWDAPGGWKRGGWKQAESTSDHNYTGPKTRVCLQGTRKLDCPAEIQIRTVKVYSNYSINLDDCKSGRMVRTREEEMMLALTPT